MKILLIGPLPDPITGQSLINKKLVDNYSNLTGNPLSFIDTSHPELEEKNGVLSFKKMYYNLIQYFKLSLIFRSDLIYMSIGQTFFGVLRFLPYFLAAKIFSKKIVIHIHGNHLRNEYESLRGLKKKIFRSILALSDRG